MPITKDDVPEYDDEFTFGPYTIKCMTAHDDGMGEPWDEDCRHGPVSDWTRADKAPGQRVLFEDRGSRRCYDVQGAMKIAVRDGWDVPPCGEGTPKQRAARAVEADFQRLRAWCNNEWCYVYVGAEVRRDGELVGEDSLGGVESDGGYWRECVAEMANSIIRAHEQELKQRAEWNARDVVTKG